VEAREEGVTHGSPEALTAAEREQGHRELLARMDPANRAACEASGCVHDARRLVAFIYLLLRDHVPCGLLGEVVRMLDAPSEPLPVAIQCTSLARRLSAQEPCTRLLDWLAAVEAQGLAERATLWSIANSLPEQDDTETLYTNGWLARYAQYIADRIEHGTQQEQRVAASGDAT
jgi:hypothetical protein